MGKGLWIGLGLAGGVGAILALESRKPLVAAASKPLVAAASTVVATVQRGAQTARETVARGARRMSGVPQSMLGNIERFKIWDLVHQYGAFPDALFMALLEMESGFSPSVYNWYKNYQDYLDPTVPTIDPSKPHKLASKVGIRGYPNGHATSGAPLVTKWTKPGDGGCAHDPHACGLGQIVDWLRTEAKPFGYGGVPLPYLNDLFDAEKNIHAVGANLNRQWAKIQAVPGIPAPVQWALLYLSHNQGGGPLGAALASTADRTSATAMFAAAKRTGAPLTVAVRVATRVPVWAAIKAARGGG